MALFGTKSKKAPAGKTAKKKAAVKAPAARAAGAVADVDGRLEGVLRAPWLSEKALIGTEHGVYVFAIPSEATKHDVARAVEKLYKVVPRKVAVVNMPGKRKPLRNKRGWGTRAARRKAYVYLAKGETIAFA